MAEGGRQRGGGGGVSTVALRLISQHTIYWITATATNSKQLAKYKNSLYFFQLASYILSFQHVQYLRAIILET